jgi:folate-binding protein YgfZ
MSDSKILSRWGIIGVEGADAVNFLHAQLSNDLANLPENTLQIAGLCTAKGRLLSTFFVLRRAETVMLVCRRELVGALVKRLSMFVLRSKCKVMDWCDQWALEFVPNIPEAQHAMHVAWLANHEAVASLRPWQGQLCGFRVLSLQSDTSVRVLDGAMDDAFELALFNLGIAHIAPNMVEQLIPQAINLDLVGGISFSKGCYPGQEVVARSHYLGKVKRRAFKATSESPLLQTGADIWLQGKDNEPIGQIIAAVEQQYALVELPLEVVETEGALFFVKTDEGETPLCIQAPPYDVHQKGNQFEAL